MSALGSAKEVVGKDSGKGKRWDLRSLVLMAVLWFATLFISAAYSMIAPFFPREAQKKGCSLFVVGLVISASPFCVFITSPLFGYLLPKLGIKFSILSGMFLVGGAFVLLGFLQDMPYGWVFITFAVLLRMTEGVGSALSFTAIYTLLPELFPNRVGLVTGLFELGSGLGYAIGAPIGGLLYTVGGFLLPFVSVGSIVLIMIPPVFLLFRNTSCHSKVLSLRVMLKLSSNFVFLLLLIGQVVCLTALGFLNPTLQPFLHEQFGLNELQVGLVFIGVPMMYMLLALVFGGLADQFGPRGFIICGFIVSGVAFFLVGPAHFITTPRLWITIAAFVLMGAGLAPAFIPTYADLLNIAKSRHPDVETQVVTGVVSGLSSSTLSLGEFIGPLLGAAVTEVTDFQTSAMLLGQLLFAQALLLFGVTLIDKWH
jgi:MFS family permease